MGHIYKFTSPSNKIYFGQTIQTIKERFKPYNRHEGTNPHFTAALDKHKFKNFKKEIFKVPEFMLNYVETTLIRNHDTTDRKKGYNKDTGGSNGRPSKETKQLQSIIKHGANNPMYGRSHTEKFIQNMTGENNYMYGNTHTPEARKTKAETLLVMAQEVKQYTQGLRGYFAVNHHINGWDDQYDGYRQANPVSNSDGTPNMNRQTLQQYFYPKNASTTAPNSPSATRVNNIVDKLSSSFNNQGTNNGPAGSQ
jgi:group I intron endonuclease